MLVRTIVVLPAALVCALGCIAEDVPSVGGQTQGIYGGSAPDEPMHAAVVSLHRAEGSVVRDKHIFCSGTLIASDVVVTAAHCLDTASGWNPTFETRPPSTVVVYVGNGPTTSAPSSAFLRVTETRIHHDFDRLRLRNDIALMRLAAPVAGVTPVPTLPASLGFTSADVGTTVLNFAGFGETETGTYDVKLQADGVLGGLGCTVTGCTSSGDALTQISYSQSESGPCFGDSGGPAFVVRGGTAYVGGLTSYGDSGCTVFGVSTRTDPFEAWVRGFTGSAPPPDAGVCSPSGMFCSSNSDCCSRHCRGPMGRRTCK